MKYIDSLEKEDEIPGKLRYQALIYTDATIDKQGSGGQYARQQM